MSIKLKLENFENLLKEIEKAGGNVDRSAENYVRRGAEILNDELKSKMRDAKVPEDLIGRMPAPEVKNNYGFITAKAGYRKGAYDPKNPSDGYKAVFLNYGTPHRSEHGQVEERKYLDKARRAANPKIRKEQEKILEEILRGLQK